MRCYLIRNDRVTVLLQSPTALPTDGVLVQGIKDLDQVRFPVTRLVALWNALPGVDPVKRFQSRPIGLKRLWAALEALPVTSTRTDSKQAQLMALLSRPSGASMEQLMETTGWQRHSIRGVVSGVLKKKLGLTVTSKIVGENRVYRITP